MAAQPLDVRSIAERLQLSVRDASYQLYEMKQRGEVCISGHTRVEWCTKPVAQFRASNHQPAQRSGHELHALGFVLAGRRSG
ncbi:MAG: hypothetical protein AB3X44_16210 [Leptothrix sp. (in: b-proteobacteria)]